MMDVWSGAVSQNNAVAIVAIDMSKAFDCLSMDCIRASMQRLGLDECKVLENYLLNRKQFVHNDGFSSPLSDISSGVPQGSVLGPLLFILSLAEIQEYIIEALHLFADDLTTWEDGHDWPICVQKSKGD